MSLLNGKKLSQKLKDKLAIDVSQFIENYGRAPGLATILVGQDPASAVYIKNKRLACEKTGIISFHKEFDAGINEESLSQYIQELNQNPTVDGILLQLPLPEGLDAEKLLNTIDPDKDVDGFHPFNLGKLLKGEAAFVPCTPLGILKLLEEYDINPAGKHCVILGRSNIVGKPMAMLLLQKNATVTVCHSRTENIEHHVQQADIVIAAVGKAKLVKASWIKPGAIIIDVGINRESGGALCGDVDYEQVENKASWITPVPGGVGPLTIAMLLQNTLLAATQHERTIRK
ncbi:MAG TPA: bifunctional methylenetetrahydrofolate dehydrogenase/methenyltetrahydrofolate cyclohydrolase FolD [Oligoflexia bacterium]|nr:bifunctional methylenetetrahydrofolate dehydrogenase/methenyltetrahydrofolate cyclohydrolase FolD [Oligoflexia bacterium]HMR23746.1 bifunctional methylenetetrahydrofolate dehydrogenase/methenyltetrahydrofolate cyclohydrolase FolD [Oligoflexia bacterium]